MKCGMRGSTVGAGEMRVHGFTKKIKERFQNSHTYFKEIMDSFACPDGS